MNERKGFFNALLEFFTPFEVLLTTGDKLPVALEERLAQFRAPCPWLRHLIFHQTEWHLTLGSLSAFTHSLCGRHLLPSLTWSVRKGDTSLGLCASGSWDNILVNGSKLTDDERLFDWINQLKEQEIVESFESTAGKNNNLKPIR